MHKLLAGTGCLLLLLAALMLASGDDAASAGISGQRLRVQQVLAGAAPCVTCHTAVSDIPRLDLETGRAGSTLSVASPLISGVHIQPNIKNEIAHTNALRQSIGARLLAVSTDDLAEYTTAVDEFVAASEALDQADSLAEQRDVRQALDAVEQRVRTLEHKANPYRLRAAVDAPAPDDDSALSAPPVPQPPVALLVTALAIVPVLFAAWRCEVASWIRPPRFARGGRRRGPPLEGAPRHFCFWKREIASVAGAVSFFVLSGSVLP